MKIVVLDGYTENPGDLSWEPIEQFGELRVYDRTSLYDEAEIISRIGDAEVVFTNKTPLSRAVLTACPNLKYISVLATGYNIVDTACARELGIPVSNVPAYGTAAVSQFAIALLLELCHRIGHHSDAVHAGKWSENPDFCFWDYPLTELSGKTMGILGFGRIGKATGRIARALGMNVLACSPHPSEEGRELAEYVSFDELLARSDVISLHCSLGAENTGIICRESIAKMRDGVLLVNTARGQLIVEADLADALNTGKVAGAAVDVVSAEPIRKDNPLLTAKNCIITPHIAWAPAECRERIMDCSAQNLRSFLQGQPQNVVN